MLPQEFQGAWRRVGLLIDGRRRVDYCDVLWIQTGDWFVDVRTLIQSGVTPEPGSIEHAFAQEISFAGTTTYQDSKLAWRHLLDSRETAPPDENTVAWRDQLLVENGAFEWEGRQVSFVEEWSSLGRSHVNGTGRADFVRVEAAGLALEATQDGSHFNAVKYQHTGKGWLELERVRTINR